HRLVVALENALTQLGISPDEANPWLYPSIAGYANILEKYGLEVREALLFERPTKLEDGERGFANFIYMFGSSFLKRVPEASQPEYIRVAERIARPHLWKTDHWELDYRRLRVDARKTALNAAGR